jgi:PAS domain S-box-containing protein
MTVHTTTSGVGLAPQLLAEGFDLAPVALVLVDPAGCLLAANAAFAALLGYSMEELRGRGYAELTHPDDHAVDEATTA